jgi:hypothetical protein
MSNTPDRRAAPSPETPPWWRVRMLWLVIGGPLAVVVASFATLALALRHPDPVLQPARESANAAQTPAVQARNHAAAPQR